MKTSPHCYAKTLLCCPLIIAIWEQRSENILLALQIKKYDFISDFIYLFEKHEDKGQGHS